MLKYRRSFNKLNIYIGREYLLSFFVSFIFFFFIFFVNQILVIAQKIMLKNVRISEVFTLVTLAIPQFLMYTMPFSSLSSASMIIGNFSSQNEILAIRSNGIHTIRIFLPVVFLSIIISFGTLLIADKLIPYTAVQYRNLYARMIQNIPTLELESYSTSQFGDIIISNGKVEGNVINDVMIFDNSDSSDSRVIVSEKAVITVLDLSNFLYRIDLDKPEIFITDSKSSQDFSLAKAEHLTLNIDLASNSSALVSLNPSQMSLHELKDKILERYPESLSVKAESLLQKSESISELGKDLKEIEYSGDSDISKLTNLIIHYEELENIKDNPSYSFYYQYYKSEFTKKIALSAACTCLVFMAFPLSFIKIRYGRLVGFGLSMFCACIYWFFLYYMHLESVNNPVNPAVLLWLPNLFILVFGLFLIKIMGRN